MEFQTKIVEKKKNPRARVAMVGVGLFVVAMILSTVHGYEQYVLWVFGVAMVLLIGGAVYAKGNLSSIEVSPIDLVVNVSEIRIGETTYAVPQATDLKFVVEGYDGMRKPGSGGSYQSNGSSYNGMDNYVSFEYGDQKIECRFYLPDPWHVQQLGGVFKELYARQVTFVERDLDGWRTFLFAPVTEGQWEDLMIENGYK